MREVHVTTWDVQRLSGPKNDPMTGRPLNAGDDAVELTLKAVCVSPKEAREVLRLLGVDWAGF